MPWTLAGVSAFFKSMFAPAAKWFMSRFQARDFWAPVLAALYILLLLPIVRGFFLPRFDTAIVADGFALTLIVLGIATAVHYARRAWHKHVILPQRLDIIIRDVENVFEYFKRVYVGGYPNAFRQAINATKVDYIQYVWMSEEDTRMQERAERIERAINDCKLKRTRESVRPMLEEVTLMLRSAEAGINRGRSFVKAAEIEDKLNGWAELQANIKHLEFLVTTLRPWCNQFYVSWPEAQPTVLA